MINQNVSTIILKVKYDNMGESADIEILGKTMLEWIVLALPSPNHKAVKYSDKTDIPVQIKNEIDMDSDYTVVLFSDTPLMTKKTILDAVCELGQSGKNLLKMTRGYVFKTEYLLSAEKIFNSDTVYFDEEDFITAFNFKQVSIISDILKHRILNYHLENGVQIEDINSTFIGPDVIIGKGVYVGANNHIKGKSTIKDNVKLLPNNYIENSIISENAAINSSQIYKSFIGAKTTVGPFAYIRPDSVIGEKCRIGDFVEIKSSVIGNDTKISHLSYVGDSEIGSKCNIGCGVVFVNYDGKNKYKTKVGNQVFIGSNCNIIAPVLLQDGAFVAAGSTINKDVGKKTLAIARARQENKPSWQGNNYYKEE